MLSTSQIAMAEMFDLDFALTMPEDSTAELNKQNPDAQSKEDACQVLDEMPTVVMGGDAHCTVCMERFRLGGAGKKANCGHVFHENCIDQWLAIRNSCPLCRRKIYGDGEDI